MDYTQEFKEYYKDFCIVDWENFNPMDYNKVKALMEKSKWACYQKDDDLQIMSQSLFSDYISTFSNEIIIPMFGDAILIKELNNEIMENIANSLFNFICENRNTIVSVGLKYFTMIECEQMDDYGGYRFIMDTMDKDGKTYVFDKWDW